MTLMATGTQTAVFSIIKKGVIVEPKRSRFEYEIIPFLLAV
jgi:hypothetical protein